jgi:putative endonuclease
MPYVYILYSQLLDKYYIGATRDIAELRLKKHLSIHKGFTNNANDWGIIHKEYFEDYLHALAREKQIKGWKSKIMIEKLINNSNGSEHPDFTSGGS